MNQTWITEKGNEDFRIQYKVSRVLYSKKSLFQKITVIENPFFGKMLINDNIVMITEKDEFIYHEMIVHVPLFTHSCPQKVLVIGGGDGGSVREILKHSSVKKVVLVEIDNDVVEVCKKFIPQLSSFISNARCQYFCQDGADFVRNTQEFFDVILIDSTDPAGPSLSLFTEEFYQNIVKILKKDGIVVCQAESPYLYEKEQKEIINIYKKYFKNVYLYKYFNLSYPLGMWCFAIGSQERSPLDSLVLQRAEKRRFETQYYTRKIHKESFVLPAFLERRFASKIKNIDHE